MDQSIAYGSEMSQKIDEVMAAQNAKIAEMGEAVASVPEEEESAF